MTKLNSAPGDNSIDFESGLKPEDIKVESPAENLKRMEELSKRFDIQTTIPEDIKSESVNEEPKKIISSYEAALNRHGASLNQEVVEKEIVIDNQESQRVEKLAMDHRKRVISGLNEDYKRVIKYNNEAINGDYYNSGENKTKYSTFIKQLRRDTAEKTYHTILFDELLTTGKIDRASALSKAKESLGEDFNETLFSEIFERQNILYVTKDPKQDGSFKFLMEQGAFDSPADIVENNTSNLAENVKEDVVDEAMTSAELSLGGTDQQSILQNKELSDVEQSDTDEINNIEGGKDNILIEASIEAENYKREMLNNLYQKGLLKKFGFDGGDALENGNDLICEVAGRKIVLAEVLGTLIPFYCSSHGTDGKNKGKWYPFFGFKYDGWFIKGYGGLDFMNKGYGSKEIKNIMDNLDGSLGDVNTNSIDGVKFYDGLAKKADEDHPLYDYINGLIKVPNAGEQINLQGKNLYSSVMREIITKVINKENEKTVEIV